MLFQHPLDLTPVAQQNAEIPSADEGDPFRSQAVEIAGDPGPGGSLLLRFLDEPYDLLCPHVRTSSKE